MAQVLKLTGIIQEGFNKGVYIGRIKEISGLVSQGNSEEEAFENLVSMVPHLLEDKKEEVKKLMEKQNAEQSAKNPDVYHFSYQIEKRLETNEA